MKQSLSIVIGLIVIAAVVLIALRYSSTSQQVVQPTPTTTPVVGSGLTQIAPSTLPDVSPSPSTEVKAMSISIGDEGFTPSTVTIPVGTTVTFTNNGQALHWPASDPHPVHTGLAGFDAKRGLATGETYSYTFTKAGTFGMHDHLNASLKGSIVVK